MRTTTTFTALALCASLYLTTGTAQAALTNNGLTANGLHLNGLTMNGLGPNGWSLNGITLNGIALTQEPPPAVQGTSLPFNSLSHKALGKTQAERATMPRHD